MVSAAVEFPRHFVPVDLKIESWEAVEPLYRALVERPVQSAQELERWLLDFSELDAAFDEEAAGRHIAMTRATDDPEREQRFLFFVEQVIPQREPYHHKLRQRLVELAERFALPAMRYEVLLRGMRNAIELFREENIPLQVENAKLVQQYQKITGSMTVTYRGEEVTLPQLGRFLEEPDRAVREETWRLGSGRFLQDADALNKLYDDMVRVRDQMARNAGLRDFRAFAFRALERFDYTPEDCLRFHDAIESVVVPAAAKLAKKRQAQLGLETLRPWDLSVDPEGRPPLRPFEQESELVSGCSTIFHKVNPDLGKVFDGLRERGMLDLASRKGKAPGGYQATYCERRVPFIFMNAVGTESDVRTLLHEGGHAFHSWACRHDPLLSYRSSPTEFAEVASMGMECLALPHLDEFYGENANRARRRFFEEIVYFLPYMARVDALQHYVYTTVSATPEQRCDRWTTLTRRYSPYVDWTGLDREDRHSWHRKLHFFEAPFYYVEYGIAQLGALQVWVASRKNYAEAVNFYRRGLALGGSRPLPELFAAAGLRFDFSESTLRPLITEVMEEIERLQ